jgi:hypothetical protein
LGRRSQHGIAESAIARSGLPVAVTGTTINITLGELVVAARALVPNLKRIAIVGDSLDNLPAMALVAEVANHRLS